MTHDIIQLRDLLAWIQRYCADHGCRDAVPDVDGTAWQLTARQFRRTLACYIRPTPRRRHRRCPPKPPPEHPPVGACPDGAVE